MPDDKVVPMLPPAGARSRFSVARWRMNSAFREWLNSNPDTEDAREEIVVTLTVLNQLLALHLDGDCG